MVSLSLDVGLLILRVATGGLLIGFLGAVFMVLWRDYQAAVSEVTGGRLHRGQLVVVGSSNGAMEAGTSYSLLPVTSLGRAPTNTVVVGDSFASQEHALVIWRSGQWWLEDRHSSNGTLLNGDTIREPVVVSSGDVIGIGQVRLRLELD